MSVRVVKQMTQAEYPTVIQKKKERTQCIVLLPLQNQVSTYAVVFTHNFNEEY